MKKALPFLTGMMFLLFSNITRAQKITHTLDFRWQEGQLALNTQQKNLVDSLYYNLAPGESMRINMLAGIGTNTEQATRSTLSYQRASLIMMYCSTNQFSQKDYCAEIVPFSMPNVVRTNDLTLASSKSLGRKSQTYVVFNKTMSMATSKAAVDFDADFSENQRCFRVKHTRDIVLGLQSGTVIYIPANSLQQTNGLDPELEHVDVCVTEYLDVEAMALKAMTTTSSGQHLQTGGMWYISVTCNTKKLVMKTGQQYRIDVQVSGEPKDMRVFTGTEKNGLLDWKEETASKVILPEEERESLEEKTYEETDGSDSVIYSNRETSFYNDIYSLQLNDFGWINCDAFYNSPKVMDILVYGEIDDSTNVMLVYGGKRKSILPGYFCQDKKTIKFSNIAADETALLVVYKKTGKKGEIAKMVKPVLPEKNKSTRVKLVDSNTEALKTEIVATLSDL